MRITKISNHLRDERRRKGKSIAVSFEATWFWESGSDGPAGSGHVKRIPTCETIPSPRPVRKGDFEKNNCLRNKRIYASRNRQNPEFGMSFSSARCDGRNVGPALTVRQRN
jgi:hypothetical protein